MKKKPQKMKIHDIFDILDLFHYTMPFSPCQYLQHGYMYEHRKIQTETQ
jgi:hypothetical protein